MLTSKTASTLSVANSRIRPSTSLRHQPPSKTRNLITMYNLACSAIENTAQLDQTHHYAEHAPMPVSKYLHLAAFTILKMTRSRVQQSRAQQRLDRLLCCDPAPPEDVYRTGMCEIHLDLDTALDQPGRLQAARWNDRQLDPPVWKPTCNERRL